MTVEEIDKYLSKLDENNPNNIKEIKHLRRLKIIFGDNNWIYLKKLASQKRHLMLHLAKLFFY